MQPVVIEESAEPQLLEAEKAPPPPPKKEIPALLARIAYCESRNRQFDAQGNVLRGESNPQDIGKYQINLRHWGDKAEEWGHDIFSEEGNEAMALAIFERHGAAPWKWSKKCWLASL